jgi:hypothetical protein
MRRRVGEEWVDEDVKYVWNGSWWVPLDRKEIREVKKSSATVESFYQMVTDVTKSST